MAVQPYTTFPEALTAGDTMSLLLSATDFPASDGWTVTVKAIIPGSTDVIAIGPSVASGDDHAITADAATTASWAPGTYRWQSRATKGTEAYTLGTGSFVVKPSIESGADPRSLDERCLDAVNAVIEGRASEDMLEMEIGRRKLKLMSLRELLSVQGVLKARVRVANGGSLFTFHRVTFNG